MKNCGFFFFLDYVLSSFTRETFIYFDVLEVHRACVCFGSHLELCGAVLAAHGVAAGAEGGVDLLLTAQHAQEGLAQLLQLLLEQPVLPTPSTLRSVLLSVPRRAGGRRTCTRPGHQVHDAGVVQRPSGVVVHLLGRPADVEDVLLAQVDVLVEEK